MATTNPFDLLGDIDNDDPSALIAAQPEKLAPKKTQTPTQTNAQQKPLTAKMPSKPLPPSQAVREAKNDGAGRGGGRTGGRGFGRGRGSGFSRDFNQEPNNNDRVPGGYGAPEDGEMAKQSGVSRPYGDRPRPPYRGGRRGGFSNGEAGDGDRPRRVYERRSGTGRGNELKRDGAGRGNWGTPTDEIPPENDEVNANEEKRSPEKKPDEEDAAGGNKENTGNETEEKEPEDKEMTLEEYQKVVEERRKGLQGLKTEERKVTIDKELESMQPLANKKGNDDVFIKLGSDKDKRKENVEKDEKARKSVNINEFLKIDKGDSYGTRGRGRGRGYQGGYTGSNVNVAAPSIEDPGQFPTLSAKTY